MRPLVKELIISFGFFNGLWLAIGIDPQNIIISFIEPYIESLDPATKIIFIVLPILLTLGTIFTLLKIYRKGGLLGGFAVLLAFVSGLVILKNQALCIMLIIAALVLGYFSFSERNFKRK